MATRKRATQPAASAPVSDAAIVHKATQLASQDAALKQKKVWAKSLRDLAQLAAAD